MERGGREQEHLRSDLLETKTKKSNLTRRSRTPPPPHRRPPWPPAMGRREVGHCSKGKGRGFRHSRAVATGASHTSNSFKLVSVTGPLPPLSSSCMLIRSSTSKLVTRLDSKDASARLGVTRHQLQTRACCHFDVDRLNAVDDVVLEAPNLSMMTGRLNRISASLSTDSALISPENLRVV